MEVRVCNPTTQKAEAGGSETGGESELHSALIWKQNNDQNEVSILPWAGLCPP